MSVVVRIGNARNEFDKCSVEIITDKSVSFSFFNELICSFGLLESAKAKAVEKVAK